MKKKIGNIYPPCTNKCNLSFKNLAAFTLAEILLSLTVIGIVAAIALPSLLGNANERAWETQKKALYTRFSQAIPLLPSLNGYGELKGNLSTCASTNSCFDDDELVDTAAESFVRDGLSKVMKIANICDNDHLSDCGLPDKIIPINGGTAINLSSIKSLGTLNSAFRGKIHSNSYANTNDISYEQLDTKAASFETVNGESVLVYYNPNCEADLYEVDFRYSQPKMCANFVYDLNGKKGPNTVGKDIGVITALYSTNSVVVAPNPYPENATNGVSFTDYSSVCKNADDNAKLPSIEELMSIYCNKILFSFEKKTGVAYWSNTKTSSNYVFVQGADYGVIYTSKTKNRPVRCVKR